MLNSSDAQRFGAPKYREGSRTRLVESRDGQAPKSGGKTVDTAHWGPIYCRDGRTLDSDSEFLTRTANATSRIRFEGCPKQTNSLVLDDVFGPIFARDAMNQPVNPYASPAPLPYPSNQLNVGQPGPPIPAGQGARFLNLVIDYLVLYAIGIAWGVVAAVVAGEQGLAFMQSAIGYMLSVTISLLYFGVLEATTSRTLGKLVTGTKVVNENGGAPTTGQILGRTFCRLIPFEAFSFFGTPTRGWHDKIPKTYVVKAR